MTKQIDEQEASQTRRQALVDLIGQHLSGTYHCTRVWSAWNVGTMSQDDFEDVGESDTPTELADAILASPIFLVSDPSPSSSSGGILDDKTVDEVNAALDILDTLSAGLINAPSELVEGLSKVRKLIFKLSWEHPSLTLDSPPADAIQESYDFQDRAKIGALNLTTPHPLSGYTFALERQVEWLKDRLTDRELPENSTKDNEAYLLESGMPKLPPAEGYVVQNPMSGDQWRAYVALMLYRQHTMLTNTRDGEPADMTGVPWAHWYRTNAEYPLTGPSFVRLWEGMADLALEARDTPHLYQARDVLVTAIKRMRAAHVPCADLVAIVEQFLRDTKMEGRP